MFGMTEEEYNKAMDEIYQNVDDYLPTESDLDRMFIDVNVFDSIDAFDLDSRFSNSLNLITSIDALRKENLEENRVYIERGIEQFNNAFSHLSVAKNYKAKSLYPDSFTVDSSFESMSNYLGGLHSEYQKPFDFTDDTDIEVSSVPFEQMKSYAQGRNHDMTEIDYIEQKKRLDSEYENVLREYDDYRLYESSDLIDVKVESLYNKGMITNKSEELEARDFYKNLGEESKRNGDKALSALMERVDTHFDDLSFECKELVSEDLYDYRQKSDEEYGEMVKNMLEKEENTNHISYGVDLSKKVEASVEKESEKLPSKAKDIKKDFGPTEVSKKDAKHEAYKKHVERERMESLKRRGMFNSVEDGVSNPDYDFDEYDDDIELD